MKTMTLTNQDIYLLTQSLNKMFEDFDQYLPVKVNFYIQRNRQNLIILFQEIENLKNDIIRKFGEVNEDQTEIVVPDEKLEEANKEILDLFALTQNVDIHTISIEDFPEDMSFTPEQMGTLMFMID